MSVLSHVFYIETTIVIIIFGLAVQSAVPKSRWS